MNSVEFEKIVDDAEYINYDYGDHGETVLSVHFQSCFYFWNGHTPEIRQAILNCYTKYIELWGSHIKWGFDPLKDWKQKKISNLPSLQDVITKRADPDDIIEWYVADGSFEDDEIEYANKYVFSLLTNRAWQIQHGNILYFRLPRDLFFNQSTQEEILRFNQYCIQQLRPWYMVSGMQAATPFSDQGVKIDLVSQARDFKGIYIEDSWDTMRMPYGIRSFDWLTFVSNDLSEKIGGVLKLQDTLRKAKLRFQTIANGVLIQASDYPELIPNGTPDPESYLKLNHILRPLRDGNYGSMGDATYLGDNDRSQSFDIPLTDLWMRRFDHERVWNDLESTAKSRKPESIVKLSTSHICEISGRYRYEDDYDYVRNEPMPFEEPDNRENDHRSYIILNKGDIAPYYLKLGQHGELLETMEIEWTLFEEFNY